MTEPALFDKLYPQKGTIPAEFDLTEAVTQTEYLVDGQMRQWDGPLQEVRSPVCMETEAGCAPVILGQYPRLTPKEFLEALDAAVRAYDYGRGAWPTMSVQGRIEALADFAYRMEQKKAETVKLLMWEIGKSYADSEKEFDRTITYIQDTLEAMKDLDRVSSRFVIQGGIIGQIRRAPLGVVLCMGPFNYPLNETMTTLIPALLMGNTVVFKPPRFGVLLFREILKAFQGGLPARRGQYRLRGWIGHHRTVDDQRKSGCAGFHRDQPGGRRDPAAAPQAAPAADRAGTGCKEPRHHPGRRRP